VKAIYSLVQLLVGRQDCSRPGEVVRPRQIDTGVIQSIRTTTWRRGWRFAEFGRWSNRVPWWWDA